MINTTITSELNLARKWRPKDFSSIVGQDMSIRMLKNSLYLKKFFPVYLFAGQRGCGKTSTARVFAAATNCLQLTTFQQDPTATSLPCLVCPSCIAMLNNHHPDFIEIDAASHTGVDNVRQIIDASAYMPQFGQKKIYLIDEAHMLSKAAFNALLKILEEPPMTVLFILATTEIHKVPETILSRCFQVIFSPIETINLKNHLQQICQQEQIIINDTAINLILAETEGSARDAINLIERVRFSGDSVTEETVLKVLGKISNQTLLTLFDILVGQRPQDLLPHLQFMAFETLSPTILWDMIVMFTRILLWTKYGITTLSPAWASQKNAISALAEKCSLTRLHAIMQLLWTQEEIFIKTNKKHAFLEMTLLQLCEQVNLVDLDPLLQAIKSGQQNSFPSDHDTPQQKFRPVTSLNATPPVAQSPQPTQQTNNPQPSTPWTNFLEKITTLSDPLLHSIFFQAKMLGIPENNTLVSLQLSNNGKFFKDKIEECRSQWLVHLQAIFSGCNGFHFIENPTPPADPTPKTITLPPPPPVGETRTGTTANYPPKKFTQPGKGPYASYSKTPVVSNLEPISIDDKEKWPLANLILSHFPGKMRKLKA